MTPLPARRKAVGEFSRSPAPSPSPGARTITDGIAGDCGPIAKIATPVTVAEWPRGNETIRVRLDHYRGRDTIDIRAWYRDGAGELRPGKSGITLSAGHLPKLARALADAMRCYDGERDG